MSDNKLLVNNSLQKALQIIEFMAESKGPLRLQDIAAGVGYPASTVIRFLNTLMKYGYVNQDKDTLKYSLSFKFCKIANQISSQLSIRDIIKPYLLELSNKCEESACLAIEENMMALYIDSVEGPDSILKTTQRIGKSAPLHSTGVGKILLLNYSNEELDTLIAQKGLLQLTKHTITTKEALLAELDKTRKRGYAIDDEECEIGARCIAAPVKDYTGKIIASISVSGPVSRMTMHKIDYIAKTIMSYSDKISRELGYTE